MTDQNCACGCGRPVTDGSARHDCAQSLAEDLRRAAGHAEDAEAVLARQTRYGGGSRSGSVDSLPYNAGASADYAVAENTIGTWARHVSEHTGRRPAWRTQIGPLCPPTGVRCAHGSCAGIRRAEAPNAVAQAAAWLAMQVDWLRGRREAEEAFDELRDACRLLERLVDRPADRELVGVCDCGKVLYAVHGREVVQCPMPMCKLVWHVERSRDILHRHLGDKLLTAAEAAHWLAFWDERTTEQIRKLINAWTSRGQITAAAEVDGEPTYRFGTLAERLARTPRRERTAA